MGGLVYFVDTHHLQGETYCVIEDGKLISFFCFLFPLPANIHSEQHMRNTMSLFAIFYISQKLYMGCTLYELKNFSFTSVFNQVWRYVEMSTLDNVGIFEMLDLILTERLTLL